VTTRRDDAPDLTVIAADDALLDALAQGEPAPDGDDLAGLFAAWRGDVDADPPADLDMAAVLSKLDEVPDDDAEPVRPAVPTGDAVPVKPVPSPRLGRWRPSRRVRRYVTGMAAALLLIAGLGAGASQAGPGSPLWPITRVVFPERADLRLAEHNIALAREAAADGRYADARRTLDKAAGNVNRVGDPKLATKLRAQIDEIRRTLPPADDQERNGTPTPAPSTSGTPPAAGNSSPPAGPGQTGQPGGQPAQPQVPEPGGGTTQQPGGIVPGLPAIPTPTLPIPIPTIPLPTLPIG
jgi:hypothetical protein